LVGWTGVQYSIFRAALAASVAQVCLSRMATVEGPSWAILALGIPGAVALAIGWRDRAVAGNLLVLVAGLGGMLDGAPLVLPAPDVIYTSVLLALHLTVPITPFGSWDARARIDPRGDWQRPQWIGTLAWLLLSLIHLARAWTHWGEATRTIAGLDFAVISTITALLEIAFALAIFRARWRPSTWVALTIWQIAWILAFGPAIGDGALLLLHAFACDPGWWPGRRLFPLALTSSASEAELGCARLFYDGDCGFCHRSVRFILSEELATPAALELRFAPLQGERFAKAIQARPDIDAEDLPDSIVLELEDGNLLTRSSAALEIASRLGGLWRGIALVGRILPVAFLDRGYDAIARVRKRLFAEPKDACPILSPELRARFDL
jgi:predicted DCC family thiol-disulfide oxidoreductase YuxK